MKKVISSSEYIFSQSVQGELHTTTEAKAELERKLNDLISQRSKDMAGKTASEWKQIEEDKKVRNWNVWYMQVLLMPASALLYIVFNRLIIQCTVNIVRVSVCDCYLYCIHVYVYLLSMLYMTYASN